MQDVAGRYFNFRSQLMFMEKEKNKLSRQKFLFWGIGITSLFAIPSFLRRKKPETKTVKMLTQDGRLVEIDAAHIPSQKKKIQPQHIHTWVTNKPTL